MSRRFRKTISALVVVTLVLPSHIPGAAAEMISTEAALASQDRRTLLTEAEAVVLHEQVTAQLSRLGVEQDHILARIRAMTDDELAALAREIDSMLAGAGAIEVIGIVFLVLLILELVGLTDIFKKI